MADHKCICQRCVKHLPAGEEPAPDGYYGDDYVRIRTVFDERLDLYGTAPHPQEVGIEITEAGRPLVQPWLASLTNLCDGKPNELVLRSGKTRFEVSCRRGELRSIGGKSDENREMDDPLPVPLDSGESGSSRLLSLRICSNSPNLLKLSCTFHQIPILRFSKNFADRDAPATIFPLDLGSS